MDVSGRPGRNKPTKQMAWPEKEERVKKKTLNKKNPNKTVERKKSKVPGCGEGGGCSAPGGMGLGAVRP